MSEALKLSRDDPNKGALPSNVRTLFSFLRLPLLASEVDLLSLDRSSSSSRDRRSPSSRFSALRFSLLLASFLDLSAQARPMLCLLPSNAAYGRSPRSTLQKAENTELPLERKTRHMVHFAPSTLFLKKRQNAHYIRSNGRFHPKMERSALRIALQMHHQMFVLWQAPRPPHPLFPRSLPSYAV